MVGRILEGRTSQTYPLARVVGEVWRSVEANLDDVRGKEFGFQDVECHVFRSQTDDLEHSKHIMIYVNT
jgi:hypothetical protein